MLPIRVRQFPQFAHQMVKRSAIAARPLERQPLFRLCYFTCQSYFRYTYCALHSLKANIGDSRYEVICFNDTDQPMSEAQIVALGELMPGIRVVPWPKSMGWGATQIGWIWRAYEMAAEGLHDDDVVARIDADVFFFNDTIFRAVERSKADLIGDGHYVDFEYCQGGCYFFRAGAVRRIVRLIEQQTLEALLDGMDIVVEDVAATRLARKLGMDVWMTWFMMFPDELRNAGHLTPWARTKFSCAHFVMKNKAAMLEAYRRDMLPAPERAAFDEVIEIA